MRQQHILQERLIGLATLALNVWANTAYRSAANEEWLGRHGRRSPFITESHAAG